MNDYYFNLPMPDEHQRPEQIRQLLQKARKENALQVGGYVCCWIMCGAAAIGVGGWVRVCVCVCVCAVVDVAAKACQADAASAHNCFASVPVSEFA